MNSEDQRIAIAKALRVHVPRPLCFGIPHDERAANHIGSHIQFYTCAQCGGWRSNCDTKWTAETNDEFKDWLNDLNACHEMEKVLNDAQWMIYEGELLDITLRDDGKPVCRHHAAIAAQRAEAFLKTLNLWQE